MERHSPERGSHADPAPGAATTTRHMTTLSGYHEPVSRPPLLVGANKWEDDRRDRHYPELGEHQCHGQVSALDVVAGPHDEL